MTDEPLKLVAKIQHFYDVMLNFSQEFDDGVIVGQNFNEIDKLQNHQKSLEIRSLIDEYDKVFSDLLYKSSR